MTTDNARVGSVSTYVSFHWRRAGNIKLLYTQSGDIHRVWMPNVQARAGLYRVTVVHSIGRLVYIGESDNVSLRLRAYEAVRNSQKFRTTARLAYEIRDALRSDRSAWVDVAFQAKVDLGSGKQRLNMRSKLERRHAESAAVLSDPARFDEMAILMNRDLGDHVFLDPIDELH